jgi:CrcB protein
VTVLLVLLGGAVGAPVRYLSDLAVQRRHGGPFPWGTLTVNVVGSLVLGVTAGAVSAGGGPAWVLTLVGTGFCGALTTFSTFGFETVRLVQERCARAAIGSVTLSVTAGLAACALGWWVGSGLTA